MVSNETNDMDEDDDEQQWNKDNVFKEDSNDDIEAYIQRRRRRNSESQYHTDPSHHSNWHQKKIVISLAIADFTSYLSMSVMSPFFPSVGAMKGISETWVGLIFASYALFVFLVSPIWGHTIRHIGPRFMFLSGMFLAGCSNILFGLLDLSPPGTTFIVLCLCVRCLEAVGTAAFITAVFSIIIAEFPDNVGTVVGTMEVFVGLGMIVGPALGGVLYGLGGFKAPFISIGVFRVCVCFPLSFWILPKEVIVNTSTNSAHSSSSTSSGGNEEGSSTYTRLREDDANNLLLPATIKPDSTEPPSALSLILSPTVILVCLCVTVTSSTWGFIDPTMEPHLEEFGLASDMLGLIFLLASATYAIFCPLWGYLGDRMVDTSPMIATGLAFCSLCLFFMGPSPLLPFPNELWPNLVSLSVLGGANALALIPTFQMVVEAASDRGLPDDLNTYGLISGLWGSFYSLGEFIGPASAGGLVEGLGFPWASTTYSAVIMTTAFAMAIFSIFRWHRRRRAASWRRHERAGLVRDQYGRINCVETTKLVPTNVRTGDRIISRMYCDPSIMESSA